MITNKAIHLSEYTALLLKETFDAIVLTQRHQIENHIALKNALLLSDDALKTTYFKEGTLDEIQSFRKIGSALVEQGFPKLSIEKGRVLTKVTYSQTTHNGNMGIRPINDSDPIVLSKNKALFGELEIHFTVK